jgi:phosphopantetheine--protein transferase-like protein
MDQEKLEIIKDIVSKYTQLSVERIDENTHLGKSAFKGSIMIHRMYAELEKKGVNVAKYHLIDTFGNLVKAINGELVDSNSTPDSKLVINANSSKRPKGGDLNIRAIGIDIEHVDNLPDAADYRTDEFYSSHFSHEEIAHCIASNDPKLSFAGLFAAKEAIFKCSNVDDLRTIRIQFDAKGKPSCEGYLISISHSNGFAVANAMSI